MIAVLAPAVVAVAPAVVVVPAAEVVVAAAAVVVVAAAAVVVVVPEPQPITANANRPRQTPMIKTRSVTGRIGIILPFLWCIASDVASNWRLANAIEVTYHEDASREWPDSPSLGAWERPRLRGTGGCLCAAKCQRFQRPHPLVPGDCRIDGIPG